METRKVVEVDKGPVIRFIADCAMNIASFLVERSHKYATLYEYVWDIEPFDYIEVRNVPGKEKYVNEDS